MYFKVITASSYFGGLILLNHPAMNPSPSPAKHFGQTREV
jgi:hypothetical protein